MLELMLVMTVFLFGFLAMSRSLIGSMKLTETNRELALATDGARAMIEVLQGQEFSEVFALYNEDPSDDPGEPGTAPGPGFAVTGLAVVDGDDDGLVGEIVFPTLGTQLREDQADDGFQEPHDLDGDGEIDDENHATDYRLLPVLLRLRWKGRGPESSLEVRTLIADR